MSYRIALAPPLANFHDMFYVSQLRRYISDLSHVIQVDDVQVRENFTVEVSPFRVEDREVKHLRGKEILLLKVVWGGLTYRSIT